MNISFLPSICIHRSIILIFIEKSMLVDFFPTENFFPSIFDFHFHENPHFCNKSQALTVLNENSITQEDSLASCLSTSSGDSKGRPAQQQYNSNSKGETASVLILNTCLSNITLSYEACFIQFKQQTKQTKTNTENSHECREKKKNLMSTQWIRNSLLPAEQVFSTDNPNYSFILGSLFQFEWCRLSEQRLSRTNLFLVTHQTVPSFWGSLLDFEWYRFSEQISNTLTKRYQSHFFKKICWSQNRFPVLISELETSMTNDKLHVKHEQCHHQLLTVIFS